MNKQDQQQKDYDLGIYKAAAEVEGKKVEADAQRAAQAQAAKVEADAQIAEANAMKAKAEAAKSQSEVATYFPKQSKEIRANGAQKIIDNSTKDKVIVFKAEGYDGQQIPGLFDVYVHDVISEKDVIKVEKVVGGYYQKRLLSLTQSRCSMLESFVTSMQSSSSGTLVSHQSTSLHMVQPIKLRRTIL